MKAIFRWLSRFGLRRRSGLGDVGERLAAAYLRRNGYRVLGENLWSRLGEIDLFAEAPDGRTLVVVEVKSGRDEQIPPETHVSWSKQRKLVSLASRLVNRYGLDGSPGAIRRGRRRFPRRRLKRLAPPCGCVRITCVRFEHPLLLAESTLRQHRKCHELTSCEWRKPSTHLNLETWHLQLRRIRSDAG